MKKTDKKDNILTPEQEAMRLQVVDLELKARYWKAQYDIRHYTLESEKLQPDYDAFIQKSQQSLMKAIEEAKVKPETTPGISVEEKEVVDNG